MIALSPGLGERDAYFWATYSRSELDLLPVRRGRNWGIEIKYQDAPALTRSMTSALTELDLERIWVVYPGAHSYAIHDRVQCIGPEGLGEVREMPE